MENKEFLEPEERDYHSAILSIVNSDLPGDVLKESLSKYHDNDIASVLEELSSEEKDRILNIIGAEAI